MVFRLRRPPDMAPPGAPKVAIKEPPGLGGLRCRCELQLLTSTAVFSRIRASVALCIVHPTIARPLLHGSRSSRPAASRRTDGLFSPTAERLERNAMRWNRMRFHLIAFARTGVACCRRHDGSG